jgi:hypothetical protein
VAPLQEAWPTVALVMAAGWIGGSVATGQRGIGLSLAWLIPAVVAAVVAGSALVVTSLRKRPTGSIALSLAPELVAAVCAVAVLAGGLWASDALNHAWAMAPRVRMAALAPLALFVVLPMGWRLGAVSVGWAGLRSSGGAMTHALSGAASATRGPQAKVLGEVPAPELRPAHGAREKGTFRLGLLGSIGAGAMAFFMATASARLVTPDEWTIYAAAVGLVEHGRPVVFDGEPYRFTLTGTVPPSRPAVADTPAWAPGKYSLLPSLLIAPVYGVARLVGAPNPNDAAQAMPADRAPELVTLLVGPMCGAGAVTATALLSRASTSGPRAAVVAASAVATASLLWPYASTLMNLSITGGALALAVVATLRAKQHGRLVDFAYTGFFLGIASSTRYEFILLALPVWLLCAHVAWFTGSHEGSACKVAPAPASQGRPPVSGGAFPGALLRTFIFRQMAAVGAWLVVCGPLIFGWNLIRTGSIIDFGYGGEGFLSSVLDKPWYGWFGLLMSPGCGLVVHAPLVVVALMSVALLWEDDRSTATVVAGVALIGCAYYGSVSSTWCAQTTWGPRYMTSLMPVLLVPIGSLWSRLASAGSPWRRNPFAWLVLGVPWAANVLVNLLAVLVDFSRGWQDHWALGATYQTVAWVPYFSGVTAHVRLVRAWLDGGEASIDVHWLRGAAGTPTVAGAVTMGMLLIIAAAFAGRAWRLAADDGEGS